MLKPKSETLVATTQSKKLIYQLHLNTVASDTLNRYVDSDSFSELCKEGCPNYCKKWSCPPFSPCYCDYINEYSNITVCMLKMEMEQFFYIQNDYLKIKAANVILKSRIDRAMRALKSSYCNYISTGSCRLCKPCKLKENNPCAHPDIMSYSFEALGINVTDMSRDLFDTELLWYSKNHLPQYTCVVAGLLFNEGSYEDDVFKLLAQYG